MVFTVCTAYAPVKKAERITDGTFNCLQIDEIGSTSLIFQRSFSSCIVIYPCLIFVNTTHPENVVMPIRNVVFVEKSHLYSTLRHLWQLLRRLQSIVPSQFATLATDSSRTGSGVKHNYTMTFWSGSTSAPVLKKAAWLSHANVNPDCLTWPIIQK